MSRLIATFIFRWRYPLSALCVLGALVSIPRANITKIDNDITAWFSKADPVYQDYERFRAEFGGTRNLIVALQAASPEALFSRGDARLHRADHRRHRAHRHGPARRQPGHRDGRRRRARRPGCPPSHRARTAAGGPDAVRRRAARRRADSRRPRLGGRDGHGVHRQLRRGPHRRRPRRRHPADPRRRRSGTAARHPGLLQRQPRDQRDLQPHHARQPAEVHAADPLRHRRGDLFHVPIVAGRRCSRSLRWRSASCGRSASTRCSASATTSSPA